MTKRERKVVQFDRSYGPKTVEMIRSDWYCMACGKQDVWQEVGGGSDYYHDMSVHCAACGHSMCCVDEVTDPPSSETQT